MNCYRVGGAVRDTLLGYPHHETDWVVVGSTPEEMVAEGYTQVGRDFPVFLHPDTKEEYALARTERKSGPGYHGFVVHADPSVTLEEDLERRDLTINAMAMDEEGVVTDPFGGQADLNAKILRHVSPHFVEDPLRVLRVARFAARYHHLGFEVAEETLSLMSEIVAADELARQDGPRIAVFDLDGFDTHAAQGGRDGEHGEQLNNYDRVLSVLKDNLGDAYDNTLILTLTEFGRKVEQNGGYGTEHGYGTAILMAGGLVRKAEIHADWPGLRSKDLFEGQDLDATVDARSIYCAAMSACFDVDFNYMKKHAFWDEDLTDVTERLFRV